MSTESTPHPPLRGTFSPAIEAVPMRPIGFVRSAYTATSQIPKGLGATHTAEGVLEILPELEAS